MFSLINEYSSVKLSFRVNYYDLNFKLITTYYYDVYFISWFLPIMVRLYISIHNKLFIFVNVKCWTLLLYVNMLPTWVSDLLDSRKIKLTNLQTYEWLKWCVYDDVFLKKPNYVPCVCAIITWKNNNIYWFTIVTVKN